jgi:hypothetical protein
LKKGRLGNRDIAAAFALCETEDLRISYMGYAIRSSYVCNVPLLVRKK